MQMPESNMSMSENDALEYVRDNGHGLGDLSAELRDTEAVVMQAIEDVGSAYGYASKRLKANRSVIAAAVMKQGIRYLDLSEEQRGDRTVVLAAITSRPELIQRVHKKFQGDRDVVLAAVRGDGGLLGYVEEHWRNDRDLVLEAVKEDGLVFRILPKNMKSDLEVIKAALVANALAWEFVSEEDQRKVETDITVRACLATRSADAFVKFTDELLKRKWTGLDEERRDEVDDAIAHLSKFAKVLCPREGEQKLQEISAKVHNPNTEREKQKRKNELSSIFDCWSDKNAHTHARATMEWPSDVLCHIWDIVRSDLRPRLKRSAWNLLHSELKMKWTAQVLMPLWVNVSADYINHITEGNFELGHDMASIDTIRALVCTWNLKDAWKLVACVAAENDNFHTNQWMEGDVDPTEVRDLMYDKEDFYDNGSVVENPCAMVDCMAGNGVEVSVHAMSISQVPEAAR